MGAGGYRTELNHCRVGACGYNTELNVHVIAQSLFYTRALAYGGNKLNRLKRRTCLLSNNLDIGSSFKDSDYVNLVEY